MYPRVFWLCSAVRHGPYAVTAPVASSSFEAPMLGLGESPEK